MPFKPGQSGNPQGFSQSKRALSDKFCRALMHEFEKRGDKLIEKLYEKDPSTLFKVMATMVPKEMLIETRPSLTPEIVKAKCVEYLQGLETEERMAIYQAVEMIPRTQTDEIHLDS